MADPKDRERKAGDEPARTPAGGQQAAPQGQDPAQKPLSPTEAAQQQQRQKAAAPAEPAAYTNETIEGGLYAEPIGRTGKVRYKDAEGRPRNPDGSYPSGGDEAEGEGE